MVWEVLVFLVLAKPRGEMLVAPAWSRLETPVEEGAIQHRAAPRMRQVEAGVVVPTRVQQHCCVCC